MRNHYHQGGRQPSLPPWMTLLPLLFLFFTFTGLSPALAQGIEKGPGEIVICPAGEQDEHTKVLPSGFKSVSEMYSSRMLATQTATFEVTFGPGAQANPDAQAAFLFALDIWSSEIVSDVPIKVFAEFANLGPGVLASAGPSYSVRNFSPDVLPDVFYPAALANAIAGEELFPDEPFDLQVNLGTGINWYFGLDTNTPAGQFSFATVALHEIGHGLGFTAIRGVNFGQGTIRSSGSYSIYSEFVELGDGTPITSLADPSAAIANALTGGDIFQAGPSTVAALSGNPAELYAPSVFQGGSSYAHWDEAAFPAGDPNSLMTPQVGSAESTFDIGDITRGLFEDMGWVLNNAGAPTLAVSPQEVDVELLVGNSEEVILDLTNISDSLQSFSVSEDPEQAWLSVSPASGSLTAGENTSLAVTVDASVLPKGVYTSDLLISDGDSLTPTLVVPVSLTVLDGTEAPEIEVSPDSLSQTLALLQTATQTLEIANTGDDELVYSIMVDDLSGSTFAANVARTREALTRGFRSLAVTHDAENTELSRLVTASGTMNEVAAPLYAADFEDFALGELDGQMGWVTQSTPNWVIANTNPFEGTRHIRATSDGSNGAPFNNLALSPTIEVGPQPFSYASAEMQISGVGGVTWEFIPQSPGEELVNTRVRFNPDGSISVLDGGVEAFLPTGAVTPSGYFTIAVVVDRENLDMRVLLDGNLIFSGTAFAPNIEQVVLFSPMEAVGSILDVDNLEIVDGDPESFFVSVNTMGGTVQPGETDVVDVLFDARLVDSTGVYTADLVISSNDSDEPEIRVPATLNVVAPPAIALSPDSISVSINVQNDDPVAVRTITVSNNGEQPLNFTASTGPTVEEPANLLADPLAGLDMARYGYGDSGSYTESSVPASAQGRAGGTTEGVRPLPNPGTDNAEFSDSIFYDSGISFPDDFSGVQTAAYTSAVRFEVPAGGFTLTAVRNAYRTEAVSNPTVILEIREGGTTPNQGTLLLTQTINTASEEGVFLLTELDQSFSFDAGDEFWVIHKYPDGVAFPQGVDANATQRPNTYFFSSDGGNTYNGSGFVFLKRALSGSGEGYISLSPESGEVAPGESVDVEVTFDASQVANGTYRTPIIFSSNDPDEPVAEVPTTLVVSGQESEIVVNENLLDFGAVFVGGSKDLSFTIFNNGLAAINISDISIDGFQYSASVEEASIPAGDSLEVVVTFAPQTLGNLFATLTINSDADNSTQNQVFLIGVGTAPPVLELVPDIAQETLETGETGSVEFELRNLGTFPLIFSTPAATVNALLAAEDVVLNNTERIEFANRNELSKEQDDNRIGHPVEYAFGEDLGFGYRWIDSDEPGGPVYAFSDISGTGTEVSDSTADEGFFRADLPFDFEFYGNDEDEVWISGNGFLAFAEPPSFTFTNDQIPDTGTPNGGIIAALWDDLVTDEFDAAVYYQAFADRFVVQYTDVPEFLGDASETVTFQIVLYENGNIDFFYEDVETAPFLDESTVGIENEDGTDGAQVAFNTSYIKNGLAVRFIKPPFGLTPFITGAEPANGIVPPGSSVSITVNLDAAGLNDGVYYDALDLSTNDPLNADAQALVELTVIGFPEIEVAPDSLVFEPLFVGLESVQSFTVSNNGTKDLVGIISGPSGADFSSDAPDSVDLAPGESLDIEVTFSPTQDGVLSDQIVLETNDAFGNEMVVVNLSGTGIAPPVLGLDPDSISVTLAPGESTVESLTISNEGNSDLTFSVIPPSFGSGDQLVMRYPKLDLEAPATKEEPDNRVGPDVLNASGGPGTFGYAWRDNNSGGAAYNFMDISGSGTQASVSNDGNERVPLPFSFTFFGVEHDSVFIGANGFVAFEPLSGSNFSNRQIPNSLNPRSMIAGMWDDLEPADGGGVFYQGSAESFIVQWEETPGFGFFGPAPAPVTFQMILYPDGRIKLQYENTNSTIATSSTVGLQGPGPEEGLQIIFNTTYLEDGLAISITPPLASGTLLPGEAVVVDVPLSAEGLDEGVYNGDIQVQSNDPFRPLALVPVTLNVVSGPSILPPLVLVNADTDEDIGPLVDGDTIDLADYANNAFSVRAEPGDLTQSVVFGFNGNARFQVESIAPFALDGDNPNGDYNPVEFPLGENTITVTPYGSRGGRGEAGTPVTVNFTVIDSDAPCTAIEVVDYSPGKKKNNRDIASNRTDPDKALGEPEENDTYNFVSLGFGGSLTVKMACVIDDQEGDDLFIIETSFNDVGRGCNSYPEKARVEGSLDGQSWTVLADEICKDTYIDMAGSGLSALQYVRVTDISDRNRFGGGADGFDVDGIVKVPSAGVATRSGMELAYNRMPNLVPDEEVEMILYPNPVDGADLTVDVGGLVPGEYTLSLVDAQGRQVTALRQVVESTGEATGRMVYQLPTERLETGIYLLRVIDEASNVVSQQKVVRR
ncbi:choice-of-anchor D domain-containing protein [Roseivirga sp. BDSF3-8]|uniref:Ig-like domain-containing protein n=1 Tax=Roseivirga sp. BDSF3-8 TaxID=3241598 RepID=UPI0035325DED